MTTPRVSIEELSRLLDGELPPDERTGIEARLQADPLSMALLNRMRDITGRIAGAILAAPSAPSAPSEPSSPSAPSTGSCVQDDTLMQLADRRLSPDQERDLETHMLDCPPCLRRVLETLRTSTAMRRGRFPALPDAVREDDRFRAILHLRERPPSPTLGTLILPLSKGESVQGTFGLESGYRMQVTMRPVGGEVARGDFRISWADRPKGGVEFSLMERGTGRKIFRGLTDPRGEVLVKRLHPGCYDAHVPVASLTVELNIRVDA